MDMHMKEKPKSLYDIKEKAEGTAAELERLHASIEHCKREIVRVGKEIAEAKSKHEKEAAETMLQIYEHQLKVLEKERTALVN